MHHYAEGGGFKVELVWGTLAAQLVECWTLGFGSGHNLMGPGMRPMLGSAWSPLEILSLCPSLHVHTFVSTHTHSLSLSQIFKNNKVEHV